MKVTATATGFYRGSRIRPGQVFTLADDKHFSKKWMKQVSEPTKKPGHKGSKGNEPKGSEGNAPKGGSAPEVDNDGAGGPPTGEQSVI